MMTIEPKEKIDDIKVVELKKPRVLQTPSQRLTFIKNDLKIPDKISYKQKSILTFNKIKYQIYDLNGGREIFKCQSKTLTESFQLRDNSGTVLFKFDLKKINIGNYEFIVTDCITGKEKVALIDTVSSTMRNMFKVQFTNEENGHEELLYLYFEDQNKRYVFYGGLESEGGVLISKGVGLYNNEKYSFEFVQNIDRTFIFMLLFAMNRYLHCHPKEIPGNFVIMGQSFGVV